MNETVIAALPAFYRPLFFAALASTNDEAKAQADAGAPEGTLVVADEQSSGRGRMGRSFHSPPGNLYMSLLLRPGRPPEERARLSFVAAVALGEAVAPLLEGGAVSLKWPNDVLVRGRKVSGILLESASGADWLVVGIGVNIISSPPQLGSAAISLAEAGWDHANRDGFLIRFATILERWYRRWLEDGFAPVREAWLAQAAMRGELIEARLPDSRVRGTFADLDRDGTLILLTADGERRRIGAGEIFRITE